MIEKMVEKACKLIARRLTKKGLDYLIDPGGEPYLHRYYIFRRSWIANRYKSSFLFNDVAHWLSNRLPSCYLHYFYRGDSDRSLHNHPWGYSVSIILTGGYTEIRWDRNIRDTVTRTFKSGDWNVIRANDYHKVNLTDPAKGCWTLFFSGPRVQDWNFWNPLAPFSAPVPWQEYDGRADCGTLAN